ncbi:hypothetical protein [Ancylobacter oerskovii]|uniref:Uncharacterized protein n=1 Tax=Ancylobacter oerskovii TaxID=459519 RepID=A0ABW4Z3B5_9HYPH|nr:hypothetical protein [Ancylobacter oerskovii]MBS7544708.1 hypothetical protein [Ancylobacter oerskovii]
MSAHVPPPRDAKKAAIIVLAIVAAMIVAIFVGFNLYHADTLQERQAGQVDPQDLPKGPRDLQTEPPPR